MAGKEKEKLLKELTNLLRESEGEEKLNKLCETQKKQKQLETNQEAVEKASQVFNFVLTMISEPIDLKKTETKKNTFDPIRNKELIEVL